MLAVYTGSSVAALAEVAGSDDIDDVAHEPRLSRRRELGPSTPSRSGATTARRRTRSRWPGTPMPSRTTASSIARRSPARAARPTARTPAPRSISASRARASCSTTSVWYSWTPAVDGDATLTLTSGFSGWAGRLHRRRRRRARRRPPADGRQSAHRPLQSHGGDDVRDPGRRGRRRGPGSVHARMVARGRAGRTDAQLGDARERERRARVERAVVDRRRLRSRATRSTAAPRAAARPC